MAKGLVSQIKKLGRSRVSLFVAMFSNEFERVHLYSAGPWGHPRKAPSLRHACHGTILYAAGRCNGEEDKMQRKIYDAQRMATCQGLPRLMKKLGLLQKHKAKRQVEKDPISLGSKIKYDMVYDQACSERIIAKCGSIVTPVEGELTNEALFQHATDWASALRAALFPGKRLFTSPWKGARKRKDNVNKKTDNTQKPVAKSNAPYSVKHFVRKQALCLIQAHKERGTWRVDYSQMTVGDLKRLMPDSSNSLNKVGLSHQATVFQMVEGVDPLVIATCACFCLWRRSRPTCRPSRTQPVTSWH